MKTYQQLWQSLTPLYDAGEAQAIVRTVLDVKYGMTLTDIIGGKVNELSSDEETKLEEIVCRLQKGEPVQYVLGYETFCGRTFAVRPGVLIPRPETEGLIQLMHSLGSREKPAPRILDIGTGSGCIAITAALDMAGADVTAWDISEEALATAEENASTLGARVRFVRQDALRPPEDEALWDFVVSNPPYICMKERAEMSRNVLDHEPATALFVPDDDPLVFYRSIARYARRALRDGGWLLFEINPLYDGDMTAMMAEEGFEGTETYDDIFGRRRFAAAQRQDSGPATA